MALFLSENLNNRIPNISLEEALIGLSELMHEGLALTEALYQAEFINFLNEAELTSGGSIGSDAAARRAAYRQELADKEAADIEAKRDKSYDLDKRKDGKASTDSGMNFLQRAWEAIKNFGRKVWQKVKLVFNAIRNKLSLWYNKLMGNKNEVFKVPKARLEKLKAYILNLENLIIIEKRTFKEADELTSAIEKENTRHESVIDKFKDEDNSNFVQVSKSELKQLNARANECLKKSDDATAFKAKQVSEVDDKIKQLKGKIQSGSSDEVKKDIESAIAVFKKGNSLLSSLAVKNSSVANYIMSMVRDGLIDDTDKESAKRVDDMMKS